MTTQTTASESTLVKLSLLTPISGEALPITQHKDPAISHGLQGQGIMIAPLGSRIIAPCSGVITAKSATNHQLTIQVAHGALLEITCGYNAIKTHGVGFVSHVQIGQHVKTGDTLVELDLLNIKHQISHFHVALLMTNGIVKTRPVYGAVRANEDIVLTAIIKPK